MNIMMAGIDFHKADVKVREHFSMTNSQLRSQLKWLKNNYPNCECLLIATCNRTELWLSSDSEDLLSVNPAEILCQAFHKPIDQYKDYFIIHKGMDAVSYLCCLCCGLNSQIFGDDQIISQVKEALNIAREEDCAKTVLEVLFRTAITGAKKVKSNILFSNVDRSVSSATIQLLNKHNIPIKGQECLVIGNGEIGRLTAAELIKAGGNVTITLRQYKHKDAIIPAGCKIVSYDDRYEKAESCSIVVSATTSPHYTLQTAMLKYVANHPMVFIDLAIPRDIEPSCAALSNVTLFDMDCFSELTQNTQTEKLKEVNAILDEYKSEFENWYFFRNYIPDVKKIGNILGREISERLKKELRTSSLPHEEAIVLQKKIQTTSNKAVSNFLYGMRNELDYESLERLFPALLNSADRLEK